MARDVFVCHSSLDKDAANAARSALEANGISCWIAPRDPVPGVPYGRQIVEAIEQASAVLLIFSKHANDSEHVSREIETACNAAKTIVPFRIEAVMPTGDMQYYMTRIHWLDATVPPMEARLDELVAHMRRLLDGQTAAPAGAAADSQAPVRTPSEPQHNVPEQLSPLIARDAEVEEIEALLASSRLVTVTGSGGVGKTRAALQVAADLGPSNPGGAWLVDLSAIRDPALVASSISSVFNVSDTGGAEPLIERVAASLKKKHLLIVLDNCEHLIAAAAGAADRILRSCPQVSILATSQEPLGIDGEEVYRMPALAVPPQGEKTTSEGVMEYGAAALFVARARAAQRSFTLDDENAEIVADIVRRLDGIALAIELAAPRIKVLSLRQLDRRLDERFKLLSGGSRTAQARHQTLHALIGWSYDLLTEAERSFLRQLSVFRGNWTLEAAEAICADERYSDWDAVETISSLADKSLISIDDDGEERRYRLLESTRLYLTERLQEANERDAVASRHCRYFAQTARQAGSQFWLIESDAWLNGVRENLENYRAAIDWGLAVEPDLVSAATIVGSLRWLWFWTARREGRELVERIVPMLGDDAPLRVRGLLSLERAYLDVSSQTTAAAEAVRALSGGEDEPSRAGALAMLGDALGRAGRFAESMQALEEASAAARATRMPRLIASVLSVAAHWIESAGDLDRARQLLDEGSTLLRACDDKQRLAQLQIMVGELLFTEGDVPGAVASAREAEAIYRERNMDGPLCAILQNLAAYSLASRRFAEATAAAAESLDIAMQAGEAPVAALSLGHLAHAAAETGDAAAAATLLGYVDGVNAASGIVRQPTERRGYDRAMELIRGALPSELIEKLMREGAGLSQDAAAAMALTISQPATSQSA